MSTNSGAIRPYSFLLIQLNRVVDALWIFVGLYAVMHYRDEWSTQLIWLALLAATVFALLSQINYLYRSWCVAPLHDEISIIWRSWLSTLLIVVLVLYLFDYLFAINKTDVLIWFIVTPLMLVATRVVVRLALRIGRRQGRNFRTAAVVGMNEIGHRVADRILFNRWMGVRLVGYFDERALNHERLTVDGPVQLVGDMDDLLAQAAAGEIDIVYIALPMRAETRIKELIERLADTMVSVYFVADFAVFDFLHAQWETLSEMPVLRVIDSPFNGFNGFSKRLQDICLASLLLLVLGLPMLCIAIAIRLTSPGPAIQRQLRHGLGGEEFTIYKFRTAVVEASASQYQQVDDDDPRITRIGAFLRRTSIDELPQLINVLQGRMSIVGPHPHPLKLDDEHASLIQRFILRHKVRPGMTGWAQINGLHGETETLDKMRSRVEYDLEYINNWSFWFDLRILILTVVRIWRERGRFSARAAPKGSPTR
jgi:putative colanic acid biosynthesis UDP-glucose lipid carrier transferase